MSSHRGLDSRWEHVYLRCSLVFLIMPPCHPSGDRNKQLTQTGTVTYKQTNYKHTCKQGRKQARKHTRTHASQRLVLVRSWFWTRASQSLVLVLTWPWPGYILVLSCSRPDPGPGPILSWVLVLILCPVLPCPVLSFPVLSCLPDALREYCRACSVCLGH